VGDLVLLAPPSAVALGTVPPSASQSNDSGPLRVVTIDVLTTTFETADNKRVIVPHSALTNMAIVNLRVSGATAMSLGCKIAFDTPDEKLESLRTALQTYIYGLPNVWRPELHFACSDVVAGDHMQLTIHVSPVFPWSEVARLAAARSNLLFALTTALRRINITCTSPAAHTTA